MLIGGLLYLLHAFLTHYLEEGLRPQRQLLLLELRPPTSNVNCKILALSVGPLSVTMLYKINAVISLQLLAWSEH